MPAFNPEHPERAGRIIHPEGYARSKRNLDHHGWYLLLDAGTPGDIDFYYGNFGWRRGLYGELSNTYDCWQDLGRDRALKGQHISYQEHIMRGGTCCSVLCVHKNKKVIDTIEDIESFQIMVWDFACQQPVYSEVFKGSRWKGFLLQWNDDQGGAQKIRQWLLTHR